ncbi:MAG TPA: gluconate 2-dehydrogenase subunit 3 family protein [Gemmatimonadales bacterium]|nr:gluconate 2-dehydrogenase subunit 3 family protein [Gemmatimonadales bacterium]
MKRRSLVVAAAGAVAALPLLPPDIQAFTRAVRARMGSGLRTLDPHQHATVARAADLIIPATDTPPASAGNVAEFIDTVLSGWYADDDRAAFLAGLTDLDTQARTAFGKDFVDGTPAEQTSLLQGQDDETARWYRSPAKTRGPEPFFHRLKWLTVYGYYSSEAGLVKDQRFEMIPGKYVPCAPADSSATGDF